MSERNYGAGNLHQGVNPDPEKVAALEAAKERYKALLGRYGKLFTDRVAASFLRQGFAASANINAAGMALLVNGDVQSGNGYMDTAEEAMNEVSAILRDHAEDLAGDHYG